MIKIKASYEIEAMRAAGQITAATFQRLAEAIVPGVTTGELDDIAARFIRSNNATCSFWHYNGYPAHICTSVNGQVVHGIPSKHTVLHEGDIVSIDIGVCYRGYHGDSAKTFPVGKINSEAEKLIRVTRESFYEGLKQAQAGNRIFDIGAAIQGHAEKNGYSVVRSLVGHGVGSALHEDPEVPNFGIAGRGARLLAGMTLAIEPMVNQGTYHVNTLPDQWTVVTADGKLSAHYEHSVLIRDGEAEILTTC
ncbi:MAG: type I methionyl aminopeptidase [Ruminococcaceae bacterium]|nr:type I methionyl aminopeptidase [Oscillospiraceae bacterium]